MIFPITATYARAMLLIHHPWRNYTLPELTKEPIIKFQDFITKDYAPKNLLIMYHRGMLQQKKNK